MMPYIFWEVAGNEFLSLPGRHKKAGQNRTRPALKRICSIVTADPRVSAQRDDFWSWHSFHQEEPPVLIHHD